jgi:hypothetical protein
MKDITRIDVEGRRLPRGVKKLRVLTICGVRVPVIRATPEQVPELLEDGSLKDGIFCHERCCIFVREGQSKTQERDTIVHEVAHAFLHLSGIGHQLQFFLGPKAAKNFEAMEEMLVRGATPHLVGLLADNGGGAWLL